MRARGGGRFTLAGRSTRKPSPVMPAICSRVRIIAGREQHASDRPPPGVGIVVPMRRSTVANLLDVRMDAVGWPERRQVLIQDDRRALIAGIRVRVLYQEGRR